MNHRSRKKSGKNWRDFGQRSMNPLMSAEKAPLEDEFAEWLLRRKLLSRSTVETHITRLRRAVADYGIRGFLTAATADKRIRQTQIYYKEFICEYYIPLLLPLLQSDFGDENRKP